jgi:hypothetical protein
MTTVKCECGQMVKDEYQAKYYHEKTKKHIKLMASRSSESTDDIKCVECGLMYKNSPQHKYAHVRSKKHENIVTEKREREAKMAAELAASEAKMATELAIEEAKIAEAKALNDRIEARVEARIRSRTEAKAEVKVDSVDSGALELIVIRMDNLENSLKFERQERKKLQEALSAEREAREKLQEDISVAQESIRNLSSTIRTMRKEMAGRVEVERELVELMEREFDRQVVTAVVDEVAEPVVDEVVDEVAEPAVDEVVDDDNNDSDNDERYSSELEDIEEPVFDEVEYDLDYEPVEEEVDEPVKVVKRVEPVQKLGPGDGPFRSAEMCILANFEQISERFGDKRMPALLRLAERLDGIENIYLDNCIYSMETRATDINDACRKIDDNGDIVDKRDPNEKYGSYEEAITYAAEVGGYTVAQLKKLAPGKSLRTIGNIIKAARAKEIDLAGKDKEVNRDGIIVKT